MNNSSHLTIENKYLRYFLVLFLSLILTGFSTYASENHQYLWEQWAYLLHTFVGYLFTLICIPYLYHHIWRTLGFRRPIVSLSGFLVVSIFLALIGTGVHISIFGQTENTRQIYDSHVVFAIIVSCLMVTHLVIHWLWLPRHRSQVGTPKFITLSQINIKFYALIFFGLLVLVSLLTMISYSVEPNYSRQAIVENYEYPYGEHPFRPSQTETNTGTFIDEREIGNSNNCITCHKTIGEQWLSSIHKHAADDPTYVTNVSLLANKKGIAATRYCEGCHAPVALLTGQLSEGGVHGGIEDTLGNYEGIGCMGCHGISKIEHLKGVASYEFTPANPYLFADSTSPALKKLSHYLIRLNPKQHRKDMARPLLSEPEICATCHAQFMDKDMNGWGWVKMQDEYSAWLESPYSKQHHNQFANQNVINCQNCHMPLTNASNDPSANKQNKVRSHHFAAANTFVPILNQDDEQLARVIEFLTHDKMNIGIDNFQSNEKTIRFNVIVSNKGVGHNFPGGTLDVNEAWISVITTDSKGKIIYKSGDILEGNVVDPSAHFYRSLPLDAKGNLVWKHDLFNRVGEAYKDFVKAGESDIVGYKFNTKDEINFPISIEATLNYRKLNTRYAKWALKEKYFEMPIVKMANEKKSFGKTN